MKPQDFKKIEGHFTSNGLTVESARFAFAKYIESVGSSIEEFKKENGRDPNEQEIRTICNNNLSDPILNTYLELAKINQQTEEANWAKKYKGDGGFAWWGKAVVAGIAANLLFLAVVLLSFKIGKDQWDWILNELDMRPVVTDHSQTRPLPRGNETGPQQN